jgi:regulator of protease activity HflC (stomatin/prohibitin superfamily)
VTAVNPLASRMQAALGSERVAGGSRTGSSPSAAQALNKAVSLKATTLNNDQQKINDALGNPIIIGIVVIWKVVNATKAVFNVDNYAEYLSIQCDSSLRNIVRLYPYDSSDDEGETSLRGSSQEVAQKLKEEIQFKADAVGMVELALAKLSANKIVELDEERKAAMVSNLLVVLCSNKDASPVVNSGSIY